MPRLITRGGNADTLSYVLGGTQTLRIESVSLTVDASASIGGGYADVTFFTPDGMRIAESRSSANILGGTVATVTFAPDLSDTQELGLSGVGNVQTTGLVDTVLPPLTVVTVSVSDPAMAITQLRLWVEDVSDDAAAGDDEAATFGAWALVPGAGA